MNEMLLRCRQVERFFVGRQYSFIGHEENLVDVTQATKLSCLFSTNYVATPGTPSNVYSS